MKKIYCSYLGFIIVSDDFDCSYCDECGFCSNRCDDNDDD